MTGKREGEMGGKRIKCECGRVIGLDLYSIEDIKESEGTVFITCPGCGKAIDAENIDECRKRFQQK